VRTTAISGHCNIGHHEGTRPKSPSGVAFRTCEALDWCGCKCHSDIDKMFASVGRERILITNPDYRPLERSWWMPTLEDKADTLAQLSPLKLDGASPPEFTPTETGRSPRGQLEYWVKQAVETWRSEESDDLCTTKVIAELITRDHADEDANPSTGAIHSVLMRWEKIDFAMIGRDPIRFIGLAPLGMKFGLDKCKALAQLKGVR